MLSNKKIVPIDELKIGMISASDIYFEGKILLSKGIAITEPIINKLKQNYIIEKIEIYLDNNSNKTANLDSEAIKKLENTLNGFSSSLEIIFKNLSSLNTPRLDEIRIFSRKIQKQFHSTGILIRDIVLFGSGYDTIYRHSVNVAAISFILGRWLGLDENELNLLTYSAVLHDFGKMKISSFALSKRNDINSKEYQIYKNHPVIGYNFVKQISFLDSSVCFGVLMHHERIDGSGYPLGLKEDKIHKFAKIIAIADLFDEVNSKRYSEKVRGPFKALEIIQKEGLGKLDGKYCNVFLSHVINYFIGEDVLLNNGQSYKIIQVNINDLTNPLLLDDDGFLDLKKEKDVYIEKLVI